MCFIFTFRFLRFFLNTGRSDTVNMQHVFNICIFFSATSIGFNVGLLSSKQHII